PISRAGCTSPALRSGSRSSSASPGCRHSRRARSWRSAQSSQRTCSRRGGPPPPPPASAGWAGGAPGAPWAPPSRASPPPGLPPAGFAAATWIVSWLVAFALLSITWFLGGSQGLVVTGGPTTAQHYELALALTGLAALAYTALARAPFGLRLAAARDREAAARVLRVPVLHIRALAVAASGTLAGLAGALAVQLAGVADPTQYGPFLSFRLIVVVLIGGALAPLGPPAGGGR